MTVMDYCTNNKVNKLNWPNNSKTSWAELLEAWLALTSVKHHDNLLILMLLTQWLALTMLRTTGPRVSSLSPSCQSHSPVPD